MAISYYVFLLFLLYYFRSKSPAFQYWAPSIIAHYPKIDCNPPIVAKKPVHLLTIFRNTLFRKILKLGQYCFKRCRLSENWLLVSKTLLQNSYDQCSIVVMARGALNNQFLKHSQTNRKLEKWKSNNLVLSTPPTPSGGPPPQFRLHLFWEKKVHPSSSCL